MLIGRHIHSHNNNSECQLKTASCVECPGWKRPYQARFVPSSSHVDLHQRKPSSRLQRFSESLRLLRLMPNYMRRVHGLSRTGEPSSSLISETTERVSTLIKTSSRPWTTGSTAPLNLDTLPSLTYVLVHRCSSVILHNALVCSHLLRKALWCCSLTNIISKYVKPSPITWQLSCQGGSKRTFGSPAVRTKLIFRPFSTQCRVCTMSAVVEHVIAIC